MDKKRKVNMVMNLQACPVSKIKRKARHQLIGCFVKTRSGGGGSDLGTLQRASAAEMRTVISNNVRVQMRELGPEIEEFSSQKSTLLEVESPTNLLDTMKAQIESLMETVKKHTLLLDLVASDALDVSGRAFLDLILRRFFDVTLVRGEPPELRSQWLFSQAALDFAVSSVVYMTVLGKSILVTEDIIHRLRTFKQLSSLISRNTAHAFTPVKVAYAMKNPDFGVPEVQDIFTYIFGISPNKVVEDYNKDTLSPELKQKFWVNG